MAGKRKDRKGRILKTGESQRADGTYQYRYKDCVGKYRYVYAPSLDKLRKKAAVIQADLRDGIDYAAGETTVSELVERYAEIKRELSKNSQRAYSTVLKYIKGCSFGQEKIRNVKKSDAKGFYVKLHDEGKKRNTIMVYHNLLHPAFELAVEDDMIRKNPFSFKLSDVLPDDAEKRVALTKEQQTIYLQSERSFQSGKFYNDIEILINTGLRVSELYGITLDDIDFSKRCVRITKQLCRTAKNPYFIKAPKTSTGIRTIPLNDTALLAFKRALKERQTPKEEAVIDGFSNFLFLDRAGHPKVAMHLQGHMRSLQKWILKKHDADFPKVSPHSLRHTYCTNMQQAGLDVKSLQYILGHSDASVTLNVYSHTDFSAVQSAVDRLAASF